LQESKLNHWDERHMYWPLCQQRVFTCPALLEQLNVISFCFSHAFLWVCVLHIWLSGHCWASSYQWVEKGKLENRWEICLRMRYNLRGLRERDLGRVNIVIWFLSVLLAFNFRSFFLLTIKLLIYCIVGKTRKVWERSEAKKMYKIATFA
jgi:hypothetical protein